MELKDIKFDKKNYRRHSDSNKALIKKSITETGLGRSVVIDSENELIAGNGVVSQLPEGTPIRVIETDGSELVVVKRTDLKTKDEKRKKLALMDNSTADKVEWDLDTISADFDLSELPELGIEDLPEVAQLEPEITEDEVPNDEEVETRCKKGDIWQLGEHRLMCGNALMQEDIDKLLNGEHCELTFTDPPYQLDTQGGGILKTANSMKQIKNNGVDTFNPAELLLQSETNIYCHNKPLIKKYIELAEANNKPYDLCFYKKLCTVPNYKGHLMTDCEYIAIIGNQDPNKGLEKELYSKCYIGKKDHDNELSYSKPVELCAKYIKLYAKDKVLDLFGGSGSTLIACEQLKRKCRMKELDEHYCSVIIQRYINLKGNAEDVFLLNQDGTKTKYEDVINAKGRKAA